MILWQLFISYLKIGFFGFGGGYAMLSLIQNEVVVQHQWMTAAEFADIVAVSQITPGPIAINSATYVGYSVGVQTGHTWCGILGSAIATFAVCMPSLTLMILVARFFMKLKGNRLVEGAMRGMRPVVIGMIAAAALLLIFPHGDNPDDRNFIDAWSWALFGGVFVAQGQPHPADRPLGRGGNLDLLRILIRHTMKKSLKNRFKKWNIGDYVRQFSIVTGGVLLTLWLTAKIADSAKQREVRQAMQLVALELRDNLQVIQDYKWMYNDEKRVAYRLKEHDFSLDGLPADTVAYYTRRITGSMGKPYRFLTDALEMFKTTGIASDIADKQVVIDLLRCYNELGAFDNSMNIYYDQRMKAILPEQMGETLWSADTNIDKAFGKMLASKKVRNWLGMIPRAFDSRYFETNEEKLETMIAELEKRYQ